VKYVHDKDSIKYTSAYTFIPFRNGCFEGLDFCGGRYEYNDDSKTVISGIESCIFNSLRIVDNASLNSSLGAYTILGDSIILQKESGRFGESLVEYSGVIDNDTTFVIKKVKVTGSAVSSENRIKNVNFIYSFRKFSPKPDSTNNFKK
jgi:hypothetical protein